MAKVKHDVQVFATADGKFYWSCATCNTMGKHVATIDAAQEGADSHSGS